MAGSPVGQAANILGNALIPETMQRMRMPGLIEQEQRRQQVGNINAARLLSTPNAQIGTPETKSFMVNGRQVGQAAPADMRPLLSRNKQIAMFSQAFPEQSREAQFNQITNQLFPQGFSGTLGEGQIAYQNGRPVAVGPAREQPPTDIERRAAAIGLQPGTPQYVDFITQATLKPNNVTTLNMPDNKGDVKYMEEMGKLMAEDFSNLQRAGLTAQSSLQRFDRLGSLLENINTGAFKGSTTQLKSIAKASGMDLDSMGITDDVAPAEAAKAITNEISLQLRNPSGGAGMPGAMSDKDREFLVQMVPNLELTPEGNKTLIDYWKRLNKRNIEIARMSRDYMKKNDGRFDYGFYDELERYSQENSLFPEADTMLAGLSGEPTSPPVPVDMELDALLDKYAPVP